MRSLTIWATVAVTAAVAVASCGDQAGTTGPTTPSPVPVSSGSAALGCVDRPGTLTATAGQWYTSDGGGPFEPPNQPAAMEASEVASMIEASMAGSFPDFGVQGGDAGEESLTIGGCAAVRWRDLYDARHGYFVSVWRPESRVDMTGHLGLTSYEAVSDRAVVAAGRNGAGQELIVALAVAPDGTTAVVQVVSTELPPQSTVIAAAEDVLARFLAGRG